MKKYSIQDISLLVLFLLIIFGFFFYTFYLPDKNQSVLENRKLAHRPDLTADNILSGEYPKRFEQYYNDQFPLRDKIIETNAIINSDLLRQDVIKDVYVNDDGYLLSQLTEENSSEAKKVADRINKFASDMSKKGINIYTAIMPNKSTMMEREFPSYFPSFGQKNLDLVLAELTDVAHPIDSREALKKHMKEDNMFFYTDHHWQAKAAFYAYQNVMSYIIKQENLDEKVYDYVDYTWDLQGLPFYGSDARKTTSVNAAKPDRIVTAQLKGNFKPYVMKWGTRTRESLYEVKFLTMEDPYTNRYQTYMGGDYAQLTVHNPNQNNGENVLIIKDSYANAFIQFLVPHYKETHVLDLRHYNKMTIDEYVEEYNIGQVVLLNNINSIFVTPALTDFEHPGQGENQ